MTTYTGNNDHPSGVITIEEENIRVSQEGVELLKSTASIGILIITLLVLITGACSNASEDTAVLEDTTWILDSYGQQGNLEGVLEGTEIMATFDRGEDLVRGSSGCNVYSGEYRINNNQLTISELAYTEMACQEPEGIMEQ